MSPEPLLTPKQVAERLSISRSAVYALCDNGDLRCSRIGASKGRIRIEPRVVDDYLSRSQQMPATVELPKRRQADPVMGLDILRRFGYKG